eukprot:TRINITY_DN5444_c0_g1_i13.p2 TRINITY_DN5444_c0_g1~~TRINITY_DN5444_c0_g1_i13.p2  ORF type:complete len:344 (+),score=68.81 TRINITY_DN5444_c0_g1_i13:1151-2182(+)
MVLMGSGDEWIHVSTLISYLGSSVPVRLFDACVKPFLIPLHVELILVRALLPHVSNSVYAILLSRAILDSHRKTIMHCLLDASDKFLDPKEQLDVLRSLRTSFVLQKKKTYSIYRTILAARESGFSVFFGIANSVFWKIIKTVHELNIQPILVVLDSNKLHFKSACNKNSIFSELLLPSYTSRDLSFLKLIYTSTSLECCLREMKGSVHERVQQVQQFPSDQPISLPVQIFEIHEASFRLALEMNYPEVASIFLKFVSTENTQIGWESLKLTLLHGTPSLLSTLLKLKFSPKKKKKKKKKYSALIPLLSNTKEVLKLRRTSNCSFGSRNLSEASNKQCMIVFL